MAITTAKGTILNISDVASPPSYAAIGQVRSISGPTTKVRIPDITTHDTPGFWSRRIAVLIDAGDVSAKINFDHLDATHAFATGLWNQLKGLVESGWQMIFPNTAGTLAGKMYVSQHQFDVPVDNVLTAAIMFALTDAITAS